MYIYLYQAVSYERDDRPRPSVSLSAETERDDSSSLSLIIKHTFIYTLYPTHVYIIFVKKHITKVLPGIYVNPFIMSR